MTVSYSAPLLQPGRVPRSVQIMPEVNLLGFSTEDQDDNAIDTKVYLALDFLDRI